ncbi:MAG: putative spermidine/putrescine transport system substrate-binding protein, partial [Mycobacterium sp.]|nr:putative spermidine/putrescine transport system substrate-binding protein [Mycobacterium sp.]
MNKSAVAVSAASILVLANLIACAPPRKDNTGGETSSGVKVSEATSAAAFGGMDALVEAAKKEGELNVIALPPDWANYGAIIKAFSDKYGI